MPPASSYRKTTTTLFKSNKTQAMRLPKAVAFPDDVSEVEVIVIGANRLVCPVGHRWDDFFASPLRLSDDFARSDQGAAEQRDAFED